MYVGILNVHRFCISVCMPHAWNRIMEKDLPVAVEDIENETYRDHVVKSGYELFWLFVYAAHLPLLCSSNYFRPIYLEAIGGWV